MKRHVQTTGVRNWSGDAFVELQREPLMALEAVLQDLGDCIVQGCQVSRREDGTYDVSSGYVALQGIDRGVLGDQSAQRILLMPFAGVQGVAMPMYIVPQETVVNRVYNDGASKPIAYVWQAVYSASQPEAGGYVTLTAAGGRSWRDAMQDATHRMVSDAKINAWDAKADKSGTYPNMTVGHSSTADTATSAASATKATQDSDGNKISDTYLKRSGGTMTGNLALSDEIRVNGAVGNLIGRFTWSGGLKAVVGNSQDTLALLSKDAATLNGSPIITGNGGVISGNLVQKKGNCSIHTDVASYRMPDNHTGWVRIDFGLMNTELLGVIDLIVYGKGGISIDFSGYTYASSSNPTTDNWFAPKYGIRGSVDAPMPKVLFAKDNTTRRRYIMIGGDGFAWGPYGFISLSKIVLGSLGNTTGDLGISIEAVSGNYANLGLTNASVSNPSVSIEVERARQDGNGKDIPSTYATKAEVSSLSIGGCNYITGLKDNWEAGYVNQTNGSVTTADNYNVVTKDYQDISPLAGKRATISASDIPIEVTGSTYYFSLRYAFYNTDKNFISGGATDGKTPSIVSMDVPATAAYIKVSAGVGAYNYAFNNFEAIRLKLELGNYATDYSLARQDIPTVNDLPAKATTEADGLMSKEDKASLDYLSDTAGKLVILGEVTEVAELNGHPCTIKSKTAAGVTVEVIRTLSGFNINHNLGEDIFVSITPCSNDFNYRVAIWENTITVSASSKWPYDANNINWGKFAFAVFKYK